MKGLNAAYELFGKSGDQIYGAVKNGSLDFRELGSTMSDASGSVSKTFETTLSPMDEWKMTLNELKLAGADLGATLGEILLPIIQKAGDVVQSLREKWESLSPEQQKMIEQIALIVAVVGPVVSLIGSLIMGIGGLISSIGIITGALGISAAAFGGIVVAIAAVIAIIVVCITHWDQIKAKVQEVWTAISTYMSNLKDDIAKKWNDIKQNIAEKIQSIKTDLQEKWSQIKSDAIQKITDMKNDAIQKFVDLKDGIKKKIEDIKGFFTGLTLKFPKIEMPKLPHFSLDGEFSLNPPSVPHLSVDWYAKAMTNPYLFTSPTIVGAGEAGAEVMYGRDNLMRDIATATAANNEALIDGIYVAFSTALRQADLTVEINEREFGRILREARA
jgi:phage-related minor tail protein